MPVTGRSKIFTGTPPEKIRKKRQKKQNRQRKAPVRGQRVSRNRKNSQKKPGRMTVPVKQTRTQRKAEQILDNRKRRLSKPHPSRLWNRDIILFGKGTAYCLSAENCIRQMQW